MGIHHSSIHHVNIMAPPHASNLSDAQRFTCFTLVQDWIFETNNKYVEINQELINDNVELIHENDNLRGQCRVLEAQRDAARGTLETINEFAIQQTLLVSSLQVRVRRLTEELEYQRRTRRRLVYQSSGYDSQETIVLATSDEDDSDGDIL